MRYTWNATWHHPVTVNRKIQIMISSEASMHQKMLIYFSPINKSIKYKKEAGGWWGWCDAAANKISLSPHSILHRWENELWNISSPSLKLIFSTLFQWKTVIDYFFMMHSHYTVSCCWQAWNPKKQETMWLWLRRSTVRYASSHLHSPPNIYHIYIYPLAAVISNQYLALVLNPSGT